MLSLSRKSKTVRPRTDKRTLLAQLRGTRGAIDLASIMVGVLVIGIVGGVISATTFAVVPFAQNEAAKGGLAAVNTAQSAAFTLSNPNSYFAYDNHAGSVYRAAEVGDPGLKRPSERLVVETSPSGQYWVGATESDAGKIFYRASTNPEVYSIDPDAFLAAGSAAHSLLPDTLVDVLPTDVSPQTVAAVLRSVIQDTAHDFGLVEKSGFGAGVAAPAAPPVVAARVATGNYMTSTWDTRIAGCATVKIPLGGAIDATINWGDGSATVPASAMASRTYADTPGVKTVTVTGTFGSWGGWSSWTPGCITGITAWGETGTTNMLAAFRSAHNLTAVAEIPLTVTNLNYAFFSTSANPDVSNWDTRNVTNMASMFQSTTVFNKPLNAWNTGNVTDMSDMFRGATAFNKPLNSWNTGKVTTMSSMFRGATAFNEPLNSWNTSNVASMSNMFYGALAFNEPLNLWDTGKVASTSFMFTQASAFNKPLFVNTGNVTNMQFMFSDALAFNQPLNLLNTGNVTDMSGMFRGAKVFNQPVNSWNTSNVTNMSEMFSGTLAFNQPLNSWNTSKVTTILAMFSATTAFNQPLNSWDTGNVTNMQSVFRDAKMFNQNVSAWSVGKVASWFDFRLRSPLLTEYTPIKFR